MFVSVFHSHYFRWFPKTKAEWCQINHLWFDTRRFHAFSECLSQGHLRNWRMSKGSTNCPLSHPIQLPSPSFLGKMHHNAALLASNKCTAAENGQKGMNIIPSLHSRNLTLYVNKEVISNRKPEVLLKYRRCEWVAVAWSTGPSVHAFWRVFRWVRTHQAQRHQISSQISCVLILPLVGQILPLASDVDWFWNVLRLQWAPIAKYTIIPYQTEARAIARRYIWIITRRAPEMLSSTSCTWALMRSTLSLGQHWSYWLGAWHGKSKIKLGPKQQYTWTHLNSQGPGPGIAATDHNHFNWGHMPMAHIDWILNNPYPRIQIVGY